MNYEEIKKIAELSKEVYFSEKSIAPCNTEIEASEVQAALRSAVEMLDRVNIRGLENAMVSILKKHQGDNPCSMAHPLAQAIQQYIEGK